MGKIRDNATKIIEGYYGRDIHLAEPSESLKQLIAEVAEYAYCCSYNTKNRKLYVDELKRAVDERIMEETG